MYRERFKNVMSTYSHLLLGNATSLAKAGNEGGSKSATSETSLLTTAGNKRVQSDPRSPSDITGTNTLGTINFM